MEATQRHGQWLRPACCLALAMAIGLAAFPAELAQPPAATGQPGTAAGQLDLAVERSKVLTVIGAAQDVEIPLFPVQEGPGLVFKREIHEPEATALRAHFVIRQAGDAWGVGVKDGSGTRTWWVWADGATEQDFWSGELPGNTITIELWSARPSNPIQLAVDRIALTTAKTDPVSTTGDNDLSTIVDKAPWIVELGRSVARLRFISDDDKAYVCTAFLVTPEVMLTNEHCIASEAEMKSALVDFDFDRPGAVLEPRRLAALLDHDFALDYSLLRLEGSVDREPLILDTNRPADGEQLLIVQHPAGEPKQISLKDCKVDGPLVSGRSGGPTDFGHQCDTKGGSSGSPVFHFGRRSVVGLHHLGFFENSAALRNRASHIDLVLGALPEDLRDEIADQASDP